MELNFWWLFFGLKTLYFSFGEPFLTPFGLFVSLLWIFGTFWHLLCIFGASLSAVVWTFVLLFFFLNFLPSGFFGHCLGMFKYFKDYLVDKFFFFANLIQFHTLFCCCTFWPYYGVFSCAFCHILAFLGACSIHFFWRIFLKTLLHCFGTFLHLSGVC